jgi:hypothetical protein
LTRLVDGLAERVISKTTTVVVSMRDHRTIEDEWRKNKEEKDVSGTH